MNLTPFITCAVTGGGDFASKSPHVPVTPQEIADSALEAHEAGAAIVHLHVRDPHTRRGSRDTGLYRELVTIIRERNQDVIINLTGGMGGEILFGPSETPLPGDPDMDFVGPAERMKHILELKPELASLDAGSVNFDEALYATTPSWLRAMCAGYLASSVLPEIEVFELGHIELAKQLIKEGLIDKDYAATDPKLQDSKVTNSQLGSVPLLVGGGVGRYMDLMRDKDPKFKLAGAPYPVLKTGDKPELGQKEAPFSGIGAAITTSAKNPEEIVKWLDYKYGQEGHMLFNFGIEGESYALTDGYPKYTDKILKNPDKLPIAQAMGQYILAMGNGPFVQDRRYMEQYAGLPEQQKAIETWMNAKNEKWLPVLTQTAEESARFNSIMNDVNTYFNETINKLIMGIEPLDNFDKFVGTLKSMKIEDAIKLRQAALDRYNKRQ